MSGVGRVGRVAAAVVGMMMSSTALVTSCPKSSARAAFRQVRRTASPELLPTSSACAWEQRPLLRLFWPQASASVLLANGTVLAACQVAAVRLLVRAQLTTDGRVWTCLPQLRGRLQA